MRNLREVFEGYRNLRVFLYCLQEDNGEKLVIREYGTWEDIPGHWVANSTRWVSTNYGWKQVRSLLGTMAAFRCEGCGRSALDGDAHHIYGRGGGKRDDRIIIEGKRNLQWLCRTCHEEAKIERRNA